MPAQSHIAASAQYVNGDIDSSSSTLPRGMVSSIAHRRQDCAYVVLDLLHGVCCRLCDFYLTCALFPFLCRVSTAIYSCFHLMLPAAPTTKLDYLPFLEILRILMLVYY